MASAYAQYKERNRKHEGRACSRRRPTDINNILVVGPAEEGSEWSKVLEASAEV